MSRLLLFWLLAISTTYSGSVHAQVLEGLDFSEIFAALAKQFPVHVMQPTPENVLGAYVLTASASAASVTYSVAMRHNATGTLAAMQSDLIYTKNTHDDSLNNIYRTCVRRFKAGEDRDKVLPYCIDRIDKNQFTFDTKMAHIRDRAQEIRHWADFRKTNNLIAGAVWTPIIGGALLATAPVSLPIAFATAVVGVPSTLFLAAARMDYCTVQDADKFMEIAACFIKATRNAARLARQALYELHTPANDVKQRKETGEKRKKVTADIIKNSIRLTEFLSSENCVWYKW